jgi:hypothetical protein
MGAAKPGSLAGALTSWTDALCETFAGKQVAIDGKSVRGALEAATGESALHVVNAWVCEHQVVLDQYATELLFPSEFVGRGDMSRGGLLLRATDAATELIYVRVRGASLHGARPPKLAPR